MIARHARNGLFCGETRVIGVIGRGMVIVVADIVVLVLVGEGG